MSETKNKKPAHEVILDKLKILLVNLEDTHFEVAKHDNPKVAKRLSTSLEGDNLKLAMTQFGILTVLDIIKDMPFTSGVLVVLNEELSKLMTIFRNCLRLEKQGVILRNFEEVQSDIQGRLI